MSRNLFLCSVMAATGLLGCAPMQSLRPHGCGQDACDIPVTVTNCVVDPIADLMVPLPRGVRKKITWELQSQDYRFARNDAITFKTANDQFDAADWQDSGKKFKLDDKHTVAGSFEYSVNVVRIRPTFQACPTFDPRIVNQ